MKIKIKDLKIGDKIVINEEIVKILNIENDIFYLELNGENYNISKNKFYEFLSTNSRKIFTHNCQQRLVCGQLGTIASRMALDDMSATTIDGTRKGAGIVNAQGIKSHVQYYFAQQSWIKNWYKKRGLTEFGYEPGEDPNTKIDPSTIDLGEDEEISIEENKTVIEFNGIHKEIDNSKNQKFEEV